MVPRRRDWLLFLKAAAADDISSDTIFGGMMIISRMKLLYLLCFKQLVGKWISSRSPLLNGAQG
jgi:hypothetical protein